MAEPSSTTAGAAALLEHRTLEAGARLDAVAGGAALCVLARSGRPVPAVKYHEGRWAALHQVRRITRSAGAAGDVLAAAALVRTEWRAQLVALEARRAGEDWLAYRTGGVDALDALLLDLEPSS